VTFFVVTCPDIRSNFSNMRKFAFYTVVLLLLASCEHLVINASEAAQHVGKFATIKGRVASVKSLNLGQPNEVHLINLNRPHPNQDLTIVINHRYIRRFLPLTEYQGKHVQVMGKIYLYRGKPQIRLKTPNRMRVEKRVNGHIAHL